ncbi:hypothetical protein Hanom_Chr16g01506411 [Helianthus anomalus]
MIVEFVSFETVEYMHASNINVSNFVSVKLSGRNNYHIWKVQMLGLIETRGLLQITNDGAVGVESITENYRHLVRGWIFSTLNDQVLEDFYDFYGSYVQDIRRQLESTFKEPSATRDSDMAEGTYSINYYVLDFLYCFCF